MSGPEYVDALLSQYAREIGELHARVARLETGMAPNQGHVLPPPRKEYFCARCGSSLGHNYNNGIIDHKGRRVCVTSCSWSLLERVREVTQRVGTTADERMALVLHIVAIFSEIEAESDT